jgi:hypothetical protein
MLDSQHAFVYSLHHLHSDKLLTPVDCKSSLVIALQGHDRRNENGLEKVEIQGL